MVKRGGKFWIQHESGNTKTNGFSLKIKFMINEIKNQPTVTVESGQAEVREGRLSAGGQDPAVGAVVPRVGAASLGVDNCTSGHTQQVDLGGGGRIKCSCFKKSFF